MAKPYFIVHIITTEEDFPGSKKYNNFAELREFAYPGAFSSYVRDRIIVGHVSEQEFNKNYLDNIDSIKKIFLKRNSYLQPADIQ